MISQDLDASNAGLQVGYDDPVAAANAPATRDAETVLHELVAASLKRVNSG